jgi:hypothetical protein
MAVVLYTRVPELTTERYNRMMAELELDASPPAGAILHIASERLGSMNICEVWQTAQAAESFAERRLREALRRVGVKEPLSYRIEELHNLFAPDGDAIALIGATSLPSGVSWAPLAS